MLTAFRPVLVGLLAGMLGVGLALLARHLWQDHLALHELAAIEVQRQVGAQQAGQGQQGQESKP